MIAEQLNEQVAHDGRDLVARTNGYGSVEVGRVLEENYERPGAEIGKDGAAVVDEVHLKRKLDETYVMSRIESPNGNLHGGDRGHKGGGRYSGRD